MSNLTDTDNGLNGLLHGKRPDDAQALRSALPAQVVADLRTDHAGETGAVCICQGVLRFSKDPGLRDFAQRHMATERDHLRQIEEWLPSQAHSALLPVWRGLAG